MNEAIKWAGGKSALARLLGVSYAAVSQWIREGGLPPARAIQVERMSEGALRAINLVAEVDKEVVRNA